MFAFDEGNRRLKGTPYPDNVIRSANLHDAYRRRHALYILIWGAGGHRASANFKPTVYRLGTRDMAGADQTGAS